MADRIPQEFGESSSCVELVYADGSVELFSSRDEAVDFGAADADGVLPRVLTASKTGEQGFYRVIVR